MVQEIEEVHRELYPIALLDLPVLGQLEIQVRRRGAKAGTARFNTRSNRAEVISHKSEEAGVEDLRALLARVAGCASNRQRPVIADVASADQSGDVTTVISAIGEDGERTAVGSGEDAVDLPPTNRI